MENIHTYPEKDTLVEAGLEEKEALIYLAALKIGGGTISELASAMYLERSGIYYHIDKLVDLGLLEAAIQGKHRVFLPTDPNNLKKMVLDKQKRLDKMMPSLIKQFNLNMNRSNIEYFQGKDDVDRFYDRVYELMCTLESANNEVLILGSSFKKVTGANQKSLNFTPPEKQLDVQVKSILLKSDKKTESGVRPGPYIITRYNLPDTELKYIDDKYAYPSSITIFGDWVAAFDYANMIYSITENKNMTESWKMFFRFIWDNLPNKS